GSERKELWKDLQRAKRISSGWPWLLTGDFNVTMKNEEHFNGGSKVTHDMQNFIDCVNKAEVEDLCSNGVFYTWIKSPLNPQNSVLKKLDRAMVNEDLMTQFPDANALFLPYLVSDHSPVVVNFPQTFVKKKKAFRFANFITMRDTFLPTVAAGWEVKGLKYSLKSISWKNGNMAEYVDKCRKGKNGIWLYVMKLKIKNTLFDIGINKASGPDGYTSTFFKKSRKIVGEDVCMAIKEFFSTGKLLDEVNATLISLVPKVTTPNKVSDYKPIACCNSAFIQGRVIQDNILITQELLKGYDNKSRPMVCNGDVDSVKIVKQSLMEFSEISGLILNVDKSIVFFGNVKECVKERILETLPFVVGKLLLIASVLSSLNVYWATVFMIPKTVVKEIDKILKGFLWCKGEIKRGKDKVAWKSMCSPKNTISNQNNELNWHKVVWFSQCNPRIAFILWMAIKRKLQTQDKVMVWNKKDDMKCSLCSIVNDSHNHLFFECDFSRTIWEELKEKMECRDLSNSWDTLVDQYANKVFNNSIGSILR
ncbi:RNA-directed DNA polymerase, eukaryota, reverse transcriptase zinc-binding domain protein, partial [Tanacetum coccineum]